MQALSKLYPRRTSDIDEYMEEYGKQLREIATLEGINPEDPYNLFEKQRVAIGRGYGNQGEALLLMKKAVENAKTSFPDAMDLQEEVQIRYVRMLESSIPIHSDSDLLENVGQEISELAFYLNLFHTLFFGEKPTTPPIPHLLRINPPAWLSGIADVISELSKGLVAFLTDHDIPVKQQLVYELRYRDIAKTLLDFLNKYLAVYGRVINNTTRRGFFNTFRGKILGAEIVLNKHYDRRHALLLAIYTEDVIIKNLRP